MPNLRIDPSGINGHVIHVSPQSAGWTYVGFDLYLLASGESLRGQDAGRETCLVFVAGRASVEADGQNFGVIGERMSPFDGKPYSVYVPAGLQWMVRAETKAELAVCTAPGKNRQLKPRLIGPQDIRQETRGHSTSTRYVTHILPETEPADSLLVVEVITPGGHTSSFPPHQHTVDDLPRQSQLEETYYHRIRPPQGFAFQRIYTEDRSLDEAIVLEDGCLTLVPKGYHPCTAIHGYDLYYLNVMAGPKRAWKCKTAPEHEWLLKP